MRPAIRSGLFIVSVALIVMGGLPAGRVSHPPTTFSALRDFAQRQRHLEFRRQPRVVLLDGEAFVQRRYRDAGIEAKVAETFNPSKNALGYGGRSFSDDRVLASLGLQNLGEPAINFAPTELVLAYFHADSHTIVARGSSPDQVDPLGRMALVHELTHALQFGALKVNSDTQSLADPIGLSTLVEGDARRIETAYVAAMSAADKRSFDDAVVRRRAAMKTKLSSLHAQLALAPYVLGLPLTQFLLATGGEAALNALLERPPETDAFVLDPTALGKPRSQVAADAPVDAKILGFPGRLGAVAAYITLSAYLDPRLALTAVDGIAGDGAVLFERDALLCTAARFVGRTQGETEEMARALEQWVSARRDPQARVVREGNAVQLDTCATATHPNFHPSFDNAIVLPARRSAALHEIARRRLLSASQYPCVIRGLAEKFDLAALTPLDVTTPLNVEPDPTVIAACAGNSPRALGANAPSAYPLRRHG